MSKSKLKDALDAVAVLVGDTSQTPEETLADLEELRDDLEDRIAALRDDIDGK